MSLSSFAFSPVKKLLLLAAVIYFFLAPLTYHPDNKLVLYWAGLEGGKVLDIWQYGQEHFPGDSQFNYPPAHYFLDKVQYGIARVIAGSGYDEWLHSSLLDDPVVKNIAVAHQKSPAQVLLNWALSRQVVAIPKSTNLKRLEENFQVFDFELTPDEQIQLTALNRRHRFVNPSGYWGVPYFD